MLWKCIFPLLCEPLLSFLCLEVVLCCLMETALQSWKPLMHSTVGTRSPAAEASGRVLIAKLKAVLSKELGRKSSRGKGGDIEATISKLFRGEQVLQSHRDVKKEGGSACPGSWSCRGTWQGLLISIWLVLRVSGLCSLQMLALRSCDATKYQRKCLEMRQVLQSFIFYSPFQIWFWRGREA